MGKKSPKQKQRHGAQVGRSIQGHCKAVRPLRILLTCIGRRVSLVQCFRDAARGLRLKVEMIGADTTSLSAALQCCDVQCQVYPTDHPGYIRQLIRLVQEHGVDLIVPTVDLDLLRLAQARDRFERLGCRVLVSPERCIQICQDKRKTYRFLMKHGFGCPVTASVSSVLKRKGGGRRLRFPCYLKPWDGYASRGNAIIHNRRELAFYAKRISHAICQEYIMGRELTCDAYVDLQGQVRGVVPRQRLEVRAGEVSKARVVMEPRVISEVSRLVQSLQAGPGVVTVQLMVTEQGDLRFIEINPRFGGGVPLSIAAGAHFPRWILREVTGKPLTTKSLSIQDGLTMLRYDAEVWLKQEC